VTSIPLVKQSEHTQLVVEIITQMPDIRSEICLRVVVLSRSTADLLPWMVHRLLSIVLKKLSESRNIGS